MENDVVFIPEEAVAQARKREIEAQEAYEAEEVAQARRAMEELVSSSKEASPAKTAICLICQHGFNWPTAYWPIQDEYDNWFHVGCSVQPRPYMAINEEDQIWGVAGQIWWEVYCEEK